MKIGDLVRVYIGGPIMRIIGWLEDGRIAICQVLETGLLKYIAVGSLIAGIVFSTAHGHPPEDPPGQPMIEKTGADTPDVASGGRVQRNGLAEEGAWVPPVQTIPWQPIVYRDDETLPFPDRSS
jgi:hypothetical protein